MLVSQEEHNPPPPLEQTGTGAEEAQPLGSNPRQGGACAQIHTVEHPLGLDEIPEGYQNLRESLNTDAESLSGLQLHELTQLKVLRHHTNFGKKIKIEMIGQKLFIK